MRSLLTLLALPLFLIACSDSVDEQLKGTPTGGFVALFDPGSAVIPFPSSLLFSGSLDGTLNIPLSGTDSDGPRIAMNTLDGFSTVAPMSTSFSLAIDAATVPTAVRVFEATANPLTTAIVSIDNELTFGVDFIASVSSVDSTGQTLAILPLKPLKAKTTYVVVITDSLKSTDGKSVTASQIFTSARIRNPVWNEASGSLFDSFDDATAERLEPLRQLMAAQDVALDAFAAGLSADVALAWNFKTQSVADVLAVVKSVVDATPSASLILAQLPPPIVSPFGAADIFVGTLEVPYYLSAFSATSPTDPLTKFWLSATLPPPAFFPNATENFLTQFNPIPVATETQTIPVLATVPKTAAPGSGWPVVIYQHGITTNRGTALAVADAMASQGFVTVAIDLPLHGITGNETNGTEAFYAPGFAGGLLDVISTNERTFDMDLVTQDASGSITASVPDGITDSSGRHFINLASLLTTRDNLRQAVVDLFTLRKAVTSATLSGSGVDASRIYFLGHSLGGMVGSVFLALDSDVQDAVLAMPGGGIAKLLDGSPTFGPEIAAGLEAQAGISKGTGDFESFLAAAQTAVDSVDPINYAASTVAGRGLLLFEVVGDSNNLPDQVVPNHVGTLANGFQDAPAGTVPGPLGGTEPLITAQSLDGVSSTTVGADLAVVIRFTAGHHGSILTPNDALGNPDDMAALVTNVMQTATVTFFASDGAQAAVSTNTGDTAAAESVVLQP